MADPRPCRSCGRLPVVERAPQSVARCVSPTCPEQPAAYARDTVEDVVDVWDRAYGGRRD